MHQEQVIDPIEIELNKFLTDLIQKSSTNTVKTVENVENVETVETVETEKNKDLVLDGVNTVVEGTLETTDIRVRELKPTDTVVNKNIVIQNEKNKNVWKSTCLIL